MENPCKIILFGDSITKGCYPLFEKTITAEYPDHNIEVVNEGISGETSRDGLNRAHRLAESSPDVIVIGFGMNDWRKGVLEDEFYENISQMVNLFEENQSRVILRTITPAKENLRYGSNPEVDRYNNVIKKVAFKKKIKIADAHTYWRQDIKPFYRGLRNDIHPNHKGFKAICKSLMHVVPRKNIAVLWQFNGREAKCNYRCPYCYYIGLHDPGDNFIGNISQWHDGFRKNFRNQHLVIYLAFGEPTIASAFPDVVDMVSSEENWELRITSNLSQSMESYLKSKAAIEGRLHINASFHPLSTSRENFLKQLLVLRNHGVESPVIYVIYPPFLKRFESDIEFFSSHNFVVHLRRFQGVFKNKNYPYAYTDKERQRIAKYSDDGMIKYMLNQQHNSGVLSHAGTHFFIVDNVGNIGYDSNVFQPYTKYRCIFGNIFQNNYAPLLSPGPYPGYREGTVDGIANMVNGGYHELEGNNVLSFSKQGRVFFDGQKVIYGNLNKDFSKSSLRADYNFPARNLRDAVFLLPKICKRKSGQYFNLIRNGFYSESFNKFLNDCRRNL